MNNFNRFGNLLGVIYVGHSCCKFLVYAAKNAEILTCHEVKLVELVPHPGWSEFDAAVIWKSVLECIEISIKNLLILDINPSAIIALGICNQRETTVLWDSGTGFAFPAISWCDTRTNGVLVEVLRKTRNKVNFLKEATGLPLSTCFSALKIRWLMENVAEVRETCERGMLRFGTLETWILWNLTGGLENGVHVTDTTNASRTLLMNLATQQWDQRLCDFFKIPKQILPTIKSCSEIYGYVNAGLLSEVPIASMLGDQHAALLGQLCEPGTVTCNYDEGATLMFNTGQEVVDSQHGLVTTVGYKLQTATVFALEGTAPNAGSALTWLRDTLMIPMTTSNNSLSDASPSNIAESDLTLVPAFNGFHAPFWRTNSRGIIAGLNARTTPNQIVYAAYEAIAFQTRQFLESLTRDCRHWKPLQKLIVGGETIADNSLLLQLIADLCGLPVEKPQTTNTACLGTMLAAGLAMKIITLEHFKETCIPPVDIFLPSISDSQRDDRFGKWMNTVKKSLALEESSLVKIDDSVFWKDRSNERPVSYSIPAGLFIVSSFALLIIADILKK